MLTPHRLEIKEVAGGCKRRAMTHVDVLNIRYTQRPNSCEACWHRPGQRSKKLQEARFVLFRLIKKRSFNPLCVLQVASYDTCRCHLTRVRRVGTAQARGKKKREREREKKKRNCKRRAITHIAVLNILYTQRSNPCEACWHRPGLSSKKLQEESYDTCRCLNIRYTQ